MGSLDTQEHESGNDTPVRGSLPLPSRTMDKFRLPH